MLAPTLCLTQQPYRLTNLGFDPLYIIVYVFILKAEGEDIVFALEVVGATEVVFISIYGEVWGAIKFDTQADFGGVEIKDVRTDTELATEFCFFYLLTLQQAPQNRLCRSAVGAQVLTLGALRGAVDFEGEGVVVHDFLVLSLGKTGGKVYIGLSPCL